MRTGVQEPEGQCNRKNNPTTGKRGYWTAGVWGLIHINSLTRWRTSISWIREAPREKLSLKDVPSAAFSLFPNGEWQTPFWEKALGVFSFAVRHLINDLHCMNIPEANINVSTHWPGTLFKISTNTAPHLTAPFFQAFLCMWGLNQPNKCKHKEFFNRMCFLLTQKGVINFSLLFKSDHSYVSKISVSLSVSLSMPGSVCSL